jgi:predicted exporter
LLGIAAAVLIAVSLVGIRRLSFDTDVLGLLPRDGRTIPAFRSFAGHFGGLDDLYVVFTAPEGQAIAEYEVDIERWIDGLRRAPEISSVDSGRVDLSRDLGWLADRQLLLLDDDRLERAIGRLTGNGTADALASRRDLLTLPSPEIADVVRHDPLGILDLLREQLGEAARGMTRRSDGGYLSPDGRRRLVIARPSRPPYDTEFSRSLMARLDRLRADVPAAAAPLHVEFAGGHRIAVETEAIVRRESILNTVGALVLILPLLLVVFRSLWLVAIGPLPAALALTAVLGGLGLAGTTLSAAATASAAMLFGLGIDGVVILYAAHARALRQNPENPAPIDTLAGPASSMLLGMWTTAATFYGLTFVNFPSLEQLGALIGHSMVLCGLFTLLIVPALLPRRPSRRVTRRLAMPRLAGWVDRRRVAVLWAAAGVTVVLGLCALTLRIDPTLDRLRSVTPGAALLDRIGPEFGLPHDVYVVLQQGPGLDDLLGRNERMAAEIARSLTSLSFQAASALLPSQATQAARAEAVRRSGISPDHVSRLLAREGEEAGFKAGSFDPFLSRLPRLLDGAQRLTVDGYEDHGLGDLIGRFAAKTSDGWLLASYAFPRDENEAAGLATIVEKDQGTAVLTGLPLVNRELAARFLPQFLTGLGIGSAVVVLLILLTLRNWRLSLLACVPTALGLAWAAGILALARVELDLFAIFAVVTFVGIGVDYGIHLVHRYRERGLAAHAVEELAPVILVAAAITLLGYGSLTVSSYPPLRSIGLVSLVTVVTLTGASLLVLPALLPRSGAGGALPQPDRKETAS